MTGSQTNASRTALGRHLAPVWSSIAMHRPAEFNKSHLPAFLAEAAGIFLMTAARWCSPQIECSRGP